MWGYVEKIGIQSKKKTQKSKRIELEYKYISPQMRAESNKQNKRGR